MKSPVSDLFTELERVITLDTTIDIFMIIHFLHLTSRISDDFVMDFIWAWSSVTEFVNTVLQFIDGEVIVIIFFKRGGKI